MKRLALFLLLFSCEITAEAAPKLVNIIVIDMFPVEYLENYDDLFGEGGFHRFEREGVWFQNAAYMYGATLTGPGHATISTGSNPREHGIVLNDWFDRDSERTVYCVRDSLAAAVGGSGNGVSPHNLLLPGMADYFETSTHGAAKTVSLSIKDRSAVLMGGKKPDHSYWFNDDGNFVTSNYYRDQVSLWVYAFNCEKVVDLYFRKVWERIAPIEAYARCSADDVPWETGKSAKLTNVLPKVVGDSSATPDGNYYSTLMCTPFGNDVLFELSKRAIIAEQMGDDSVVDYLSISLSSNDEGGHLFGPRSHEMLDFTVRTDRQLEAWLKFLDERIGLENCLVVLTGDHGVAPAPETSCRQGEECGRLKRKDFEAALNQGLNQQYGTDSLKFVSRVQFPWLYLNQTLLDERKIDRTEFLQEVIKLGKEQPYVANVYDPENITGEKGEIVKSGFYSARCGDLYVELKPNWLATSDCTHHGTANDYDRRVPLLFLGGRLESSTVTRPVSISDLCPTVCRLAGLESVFAGSGRFLSEVTAR